MCPHMRDGGGLDPLRDTAESVALVARTHDDIAVVTRGEHGRHVEEKRAERFAPSGSNRENRKASVDGEIY